MELDQAQIDALKTKHGELHLLTASAADGSRSVAVIVKVPNRDRWMRFKEQSQDKNRRAVALEGLVRDCVVHPPAVELDQLIEKRPGLVETFGGEISTLAGLEETVVAKKL